MAEERQTTEVRDTNVTDGATDLHRETVAYSGRADGRVVARRVVWYIVGVIIALLVLRMIFLLLGANQGNAFVDFIYGLSGIFAWPFYGIFNYQPAYGHSVFEVSTLVAIIIYGLIGWAIASLFTLTRPSGTVGPTEL